MSVPAASTIAGIRMVVSAPTRIVTAIGHSLTYGSGRRSHRTGGEWGVGDGRTPSRCHARGKPTGKPEAEKGSLPQRVSLTAFRKRWDRPLTFTRTQTP